jgi:hypothetical protein
LILALLFVFALAGSAFADAPVPSVICNGNICGGTGLTNYEYQVSVDVATFGHFHVGTSDGNIADYTNVKTPTGWTFSIVEGSPSHNGFTDHGTVSSPTGECPYLLTWTASSANFEVTSFIFGFNNPRTPHDVDWEVRGYDWGTWSNWSAPVGMGAGPVHAPGVPEPGSLFAIGSGLVALAGMALRKRH